MFIVILIIPILLCLVRFRELENTYRLISVPYISTLIGQIIHENFKFSPVGNNIFNYIMDIVWALPFIYIIISWGEIKKKNQYISLYGAIYILSIFLEIYLVGLEKHRASLAISANVFIQILISINCLIVILKKNILKKTQWSMLLILISTIVVNSYLLSIDLFMYFLFSSASVKLFQTMWQWLSYLFIIGHFCRALSLWWAPKKDVFI
jgi:hypothetical protein